MARIHCKYIGCTFLDNGICGARTIELDPDEGCLTFSQLGDPFEDDDWNEDDDLDGYDEWDDDEDFGSSLYGDDGY
jgi:hypothetical protein